jgi:hypothetical protein
VTAIRNTIEDGPERHLDNEGDHLTMTKYGFGVTSLGLALVLSPAAFAQQGNMPGMNMQGQGMGTMNMPGHNTGDMDMQAMMNRCAQMRKQARSAAQVSPDMQHMMAQCDQMDRQMGTMSGSGTGQQTR